MNDKPSQHRKRASAYAEQVGAKARRKLEAQRNPPSVWFGLGMMGLVGWSVVIPTLFGAALGLWLDARFPGQHSWTLALLVAGLALGCVNAWRWISREHDGMHKDPRNKDG